MSKKEYDKDISDLAQYYVSTQNSNETKSNFLLFVGSGFSSNFQLPTWDDLGREALNYSNDRGEKLGLSEIARLQEKNCTGLELISYVASKLGEDVVKKKIAERLTVNKRSKQFSQNTKRVQHIVDFIQENNLSVITTNADNLFRNLLPKWRQQLVDEKYLSKFRKSQNSLPEKTVFYIHGNIRDHHSLVFTYRDYVEAYRSEGMRTFIQSALSKNIIFIGYSLHDVELLDIFETVHDGHNAFTFQGIYKYQEVDYSLAKIRNDAYGINTIKYYLDDNFYGELDLVFKRLREKINKFSEQKQQGKIIVKKTSEEIREDLKNSMLTEHEKVLESIDFLKTKRGKELFKKWNH